MANLVALALNHGLGERFSCALRADGRILCWGDHPLGSRQDPESPQRAILLPDVLNPVE